MDPRVQPYVFHRPSRISRRSGRYAASRACTCGGATARAAAVAAAAAALVGVPVRVCETAREAVSEADIVCTLTSAQAPVLEGAWLKPGAHVNAVGACTPLHRELDTAAVRRSRVIVDTMTACLTEPGDLVTPPVYTVGPPPV